MGSTNSWIKDNDYDEFFIIMENFEYSSKHQLLIELSKFDWNEWNQNSITLQEELMIFLSNDLGCSSPHISHVLFWEFINFMFLNLVKYKIELNSGQLKYTKIRIKHQEFDVYVGLWAPPYIDAVWTKLYSTRAYYKFWEYIFGTFLLREPLENSKIDHERRYKKTLSLLFYNRDILQI